MVKKPQILLIDDIKVNISLLKEILSDIDVEFIEAYSGYEAIEKFKNHEIALIISDVQMPGIDGFETVRRIIAGNRADYIPIIFISAIHITEADILEGIESGAIEFIPKPFSNEILKGKVKLYLKNYKYQKANEHYIKELQKVNHKINENKELLENITTSVNDAILIINKNRRIIYCNKASEKLFGINEKDIINKELKEILLSEHSGKNIHELFDMRSKSIEVKIKSKKGDISFIEYSLSKMLINTEEVLVGVFRDITEKKRKIEFELKEKELKESNKVMREFLDNITHEIKTPLNSIIGITKNILKNNSDIDSELKESIRIISESGNRLDTLIKNALQFKEKYNIKYSNIPLIHIISELNEFVSIIIKKKQLKFHMKSDDEDLPENLYTDLNKLLLCLTNVIENAFKFTLEGEINVHLYMEGDYLCFKVSDTGIGITENETYQIFEIFHQTDISDEKMYQGAGIGLAVSKQNIEVLGGRIEVYGNENKGTTVKIYHPV